MFKWILNWFIGSHDYLVPNTYANAAAAILVKSGANIRSMLVKDEGLSFNLPLIDCKAIERIFDNRGIAYSCTKKHGLISLLHRYRHRPGLLVGAVLFFVLLSISNKFIWTIEVVGNDNVDSRVIIDRLDTLGCSVGTYIPQIEFDKLHSDFLQSGDDIAWIAVNLRGTHATVEVREILKVEPVPDEDTPHNLVAAEDGVINYVEIVRGGILCEKGKLVRKGDLLASGVIETPTGFRLVHSRGKVLAEVNRNIRVEIPLEREVKVYTGREFSEKQLKILGFSIKLFKNSGNLPSNCDKIEREEKLRFLDAAELPISIHEVLWKEYGFVSEAVSEASAREEAYRKLEVEIGKLLENCELLSREIKAGMENNAYVIECKLGVLADIALEKPIYRQ